MTDIVERLREWAQQIPPGKALIEADLLNAADEIERLRKELADLKHALEVAGVSFA